MSRTDIYYKSTHFEFPELTRIHGEPTTGDLITLQCKARANASTVHSTIGGGHNGLLGLVCSPQASEKVPNSAPFVWPNAPPPIKV